MSCLPGGRVLLRLPPLAASGAWGGLVHQQVWKRTVRKEVFLLISAPLHFPKGLPQTKIRFLYFFIFFRPFSFSFFLSFCLSFCLSLSFFLSVFPCLLSLSLPPPLPPPPLSIHLIYLSPGHSPVLASPPDKVKNKRTAAVTQLIKSSPPHRSDVIICFPGHDQRGPSLRLSCLATVSP